MRFSAAVARILTVGLLTALAGTTTAQQAYPSKPIRYIVPYPPGGGSNILARLVGQKMADNLGQQVIVDNRPGGNTVIGTEALVKSAPDGYTILQVASSHVVNPHMFPTPYDAIKDFVAIATISSTELILVFHPSVPTNNLQEVIALAKSKPGELNYASAGSGGPGHLAGELLNIMAGVKLQHIPYKGSGPALIDLIGGQVQLAFQTPLASIQHIKSGRLKAIAISGETRSPALPQVPTFTEAGLANFDVKYWYGILAPAGTPKGIVDRLSAEVGKMLTSPDVREKLISQGMDPFISTSEQFAALMKADSVKFAKVIKAANIKMEN